MAQSMKDVKAITIPEGSVKQIQDSNGNIIWGSQSAFPYRKLEYLNMKNTWIDTGLKPIKAYYYLDCKLPTSFSGTWGMMFGAEGWLNGASARLWIGMQNNNGGRLFSRIKAVADTEMVQLSTINPDHIISCGIRTYNTNNTAGQWWFAIYDKTDRYNRLYGQYYTGTQYSMNMTNFNTIGINVATRQNASGNFYAQKGNSDFKLYLFRSTTDADSSPYNHYMYPCQRKSDGVCGIYDVLTSKFHPCQGTAATTCAGPIVDEYWNLQ